MTSFARILARDAIRALLPGAGVSRTLARRALRRDVRAHPARRLARLRRGVARRAALRWGLLAPVESPHGGTRHRGAHPANPHRDRRHPLAPPPSPEPGGAG